MVLQWAMKRLIKCFLKRLNKYLKEEVNLEQLDVQLGKGSASLTGVGLNTDYINQQLRSLPFIVKHGWFEHLHVGLPCDIELEGLELRVAPRPSEDLGASKQEAFTNAASSFHDDQPSAVAGDPAECKYVGVGDGIRMISQMVRGLLLGLRIKLTKVVVTFEDNDEQISISLRVPRLSYGFKDVDQGSSPDSGLIRKFISFEGAAVTFGTANGSDTEDAGVSGSVYVTIPDSETISSVDLDFSIDPVHFRITLDELQQALSLAYAFRSGKVVHQEGSIYHDTGSFYDSALQGQIQAQRAPDSSMMGVPSLPVIVDWMRKPKVDDTDLAASIDEFFECIDAWSQGGSGSSLWNLTRSAFGAPPSDGPQDLQIRCTVRARVESVYTGLIFNCPGGDGLELQLNRLGFRAEVSAAKSILDFGVQSCDIIQLVPSDAQKQYALLLAKSALPRLPGVLDGGHETDAVKLLRTVPSTQVLPTNMQWWDSLWGNVLHPAAMVVVERSPAQTKISTTFQAVVLWFDVIAVDKLSEAVSRIQVPASSTPVDTQEQSSASSFRLQLSIPCMRTIFSASDCFTPMHMLVVDLAQSGGGSEFMILEQQPKGRTGTNMVFTVTNGSLYLIQKSSCGEIVRLQSDSTGKAKVEIRWRDNRRTGPLVAKKTWDSVCAQKTCGLDGKEDFTAATRFEPSSVVDLVKSTSATSVQVLLPNLRFNFSGPEQLILFDVLPHLMRFKPGRKGAQEEGSSQVAQTVISVACRQVEAVLGLSCCTEATVGERSRTYDALQVKVSSLMLFSGLALGGDPSASYLNVQHSDAEVIGFDVELSPTFVKTRLLSCKAAVIGRGDGSGQNALATGTAGLNFTVMSWPGRQDLADTLLTGTLKGCTLVALGGRFDWVPALVALGRRCAMPFEKFGKDQEIGGRNVPYFLFDGQDVALCYEPAAEAWANPVACVLAAAAVRVCSSEVRATRMQQYVIRLKDLALNVVDAGTRRSHLPDYTSQAMQQAGYVGVARIPLAGASARINNEDGYWELDCAKTQVFLDTCYDTTAAFGRLAADLQQIFAPEFQQPTELHLRSSRGKSMESSMSSDEALEESTSGGISEGLFEGVVENAFSLLNVKRVKASVGAQHNDPSVLVADETAFSAGQTILVHEGETDSLTFIEDYYHGASTSRSQEHCSTPRTSDAPDVEPRGGWYREGPVKVFDAHVPVEKASSDRVCRKRTSPDYPKAVGRVVLSALNMRWKLYAGSDWGGSGRQMDECMEVCVSGVDLQYDCFGPTGLYASVVHADIMDLEVYDCSSRAPWPLVLGYYSKKSRPRESTSKALRMRMDAVRPNPLVPLEEYRLSLALLPVWLHLDQGHIDFLVKFFGASEASTADVAESGLANEAMLPFFQVCEIRPLTIRIDYVPRRIDFGALRCGNLAELLNFVSWKGVELHLKDVHCSGVYGWSSLMGILFGEWLEDISRHQVHKLAKGFGPIRPLCAVSAGAAKLIVFPAEQYKKDRRWLRGVRKGAVAFLQSISSEALGFGASVAGSAHHILVHTEVALGGGVLADRRGKYQPSDTKEGFQQAYQSMSQGLERSASSLLGNPVKVYQKGGGAGMAVASALKGSPAALLAPASAAADAMRQALLGVRNSLDPERKREFDAKHRRPSSW